MGSAPVIEFDVRTPLDDEALHRNVAHALTLGLGEVRPNAFPRAFPHLKVIASGPSARQATLEGPTLAVNNALALFTEQGKTPTYWAGCDPQAHLADFLKNPPTNTTYLVASKCAPEVFEALKHRKVLLWHVDDPCILDLVPIDRMTPTACSITLTSFGLMRRIGFTSFETWGWDGCYMDGKHHANDQIHNGNDENDREVVLGNPDDPDAQRFLSTKSWALEAQDAEDKINGWGHKVTIHGGGMIGAILKYRQDTRQAA